MKSVIVDTIYDASGAVSIDREVTLPMREAKTWRRGCQERMEKRGEGWRASNGTRIDANCRIWLDFV